MGEPITSLCSSLRPVNDFLEVWAGRESRKLGNSLPAFATSALPERDKAWDVPGGKKKLKIQIQKQKFSHFPQN